jgi:hypothetical protein
MAGIDNAGKIPVLVGFRRCAGYLITWPGSGDSLENPVTLLGSQSFLSVCYSRFMLFIGNSMYL